MQAARGYKIASTNAACGLALGERHANAKPQAAMMVGAGRNFTMPIEQAMERLNLLMSHAWMVRQFLKHADEVQEDEEMLDVHRMIYDYLRALDPWYQAKEAAG